MTLPVTIMDRHRAATFVNKLRDQYNRKKVAEMLEIQPIYVTFAERRTKKPNSWDQEEKLRYLCPTWCIQKILTYAKP